MSAYLCDQDTINAIATYAADHELVADAKLFADLLTLQNVASMKARYSGRPWLKAEVLDVAAAYVYERVEASACRIVEMVNEYDYQACETTNYDATLCARLVNRVLQHAGRVTQLERPGGCGAAVNPAILWTAKSSNSKTGPMPVSTTSKESCPRDCAFRDGACYAMSGPLAFLWQGLTDAGPNATWTNGVTTVSSTDWNGLCKNVSALPDDSLWRHNQAGDLPHKSGKLDAGKLRQLVKANRGKRGFTYSHHNVLQSLHNARLIQSATLAGFTINLSGNNLAHADQLADLGVAPVVCVLPSTVSGNVEVRTPKGRRVVVCPATYRDDVSCKSCGLCAVAGRGVLVGFPGHGARKRLADHISA